MGYGCPVCGDPQADDVHLANHLAFTAIARGGDHEAWLDEHVPEWGGMGEAELADAVADRAEETDYPQVFEDTTGGHGGADLPPGTEQLTPDGSLDAEAEEILAEAREMTRKRRERRREESGDNDGTADRSDDEAANDERE